MHGRVRHLKSASTVVSSKCKECGGAQSAWRVCKECGGGSICVHGRRRSYCKECGGGSICVHGRIRSRCKECRAAKARTG